VQTALRQLAQRARHVPRHAARRGQRRERGHTQREALLRGQGEGGEQPDRRRRLRPGGSEVRASEACQRAARHTLCGLGRRRRLLFFPPEAEARGRLVGPLVGPSRRRRRRTRAA